MIDLRPQFQVPSVDDFYNGPSAFVSGLQGAMQGYEQGKQASQMLQEKKRRQALAQAVSEKYPELAGMVDEDNVNDVVTKAIPVIEKQRGDTKSARDLYRDPQSGFFGESPIKGQSPFHVSSDKALEILSGQNKQDAMQSRLDEMIKSRQASDAIRNENMQKNRILRMIIAQKGMNFKINKANMDNLIKNLSGYGINVSPDDIINTYREMGGEVPATSTDTASDPLGIR